MVAHGNESEQICPLTLSAVLTAEFGNRQLHQRGDFSPPLLAWRPPPPPSRSTDVCCSGNTSVSSRFQQL